MANSAADNPALSPPSIISLEPAEQEQFGDAFAQAEPNPSCTLAAWLSGDDAVAESPRGCAVAGPKNVSVSEAKTAPTLTVSAKVPVPASDLADLAELNAALHNTHSSHYVFGNATRLGVPHHMVMLDDLTILTGRGAGQLTPYHTEVKIADNPVALLVASVWVANVKHPHGRRVHIVALNNQTHTALHFSPTELIAPPVQLQQPIQPSDAAFADQEQKETALKADETPKAASHEPREQPPARDQHSPRALRQHLPTSVCVLGTGLCPIRHPHLCCVLQSVSGTYTCFCFLLP